MTILDSLNDAQRDAVTAPLCHQLILAGAGSGKTRVLVHRIAWLIQQENISPFHILAVTFTNKAAHEMRSRIESILNISAKSMWVGTFHGLAHRFLRMHWKEAGLPEGFQILDSDDQFRLIRRVLLTLNIDDNDCPPKQVQWFINAKKDEGLEPHHLSDYGDPIVRMMIKIYQAYEEACQRAGLVDFSDLLLKMHKLWLSHPAILEDYQNRFRVVLVDEFQDTNAIQYAWIRLLVGKNNYVMTVGDDDQSIYGWRGAKVENIHQFSKDFSGARVTRLEQNYRSTGTILKAANALIDNNNGRLGKNLWTEDADGDLITLYSAFNDIDEARFLSHSIRNFQKAGHSLRDIAVLYRSNAQSRIIEESLMQFGVPYLVYGGLRYFDRAEIKDALAYLRLISNRNDDAAFERVINMPTRGIGEKTIESLRHYSQQNNVSLWRATCLLLEQNFFVMRAANALAIFFNLIESLEKNTNSLALHEQVEHVIHHSGLIDHFKKEKGEKGLARLENLEELINAARQFDLSFSSYEEKTTSILSTFLAYSALEAGGAHAENSEDSVQLMTLHSAKGLEFPIVFLCGFEEGIFPHYMARDDMSKMEEERRLCYVGMTRAMKKLFMTHAESRYMHGKEMRNRPSRFLKEIPEHFFENTGVKTKVSRSQIAPSIKNWNRSEEEGSIRIGQLVTHQKFGKGVVLQYEGRDEHARIQVRFETNEIKWLIASFVMMS